MKNNQNGSYWIIPILIVIAIIGLVIYYVYRQDLAKAKLIQEEITRQRKKLALLEQLKEKCERAAIYLRNAISGAVSYFIFSKFSWMESCALIVGSIFYILAIKLDFEKPISTLSKFYKSYTNKLTNAVFHYNSQEHLWLVTAIQAKELELKKYEWALRISK